MSGIMIILLENKKFLVLTGTFIIILLYLFCRKLLKLMKMTPDKADRTIDEVDKMSGIEFEEYAAAVLKGCGYEIEEITAQSGDYGADIIIYGDEERIAVQCKRYSRPVGVKAVQEVISAMKHYDCDKAIVITNSTYTNQAYTLAEDNEVVSLWNREDLIYMRNMANKK